ncbi:MAG TPA: hypothetical protein VFZ11_00700 [Gemmatimonadaceae bacterium]
MSARVRRLAGGTAIAAALALAGCASPESERARGGDRGADTGNRDAVVEMHEGSAPYYRVPCNTTLPECNGPMPVRTARQQVLRGDAD